MSILTSRPCGREIDEAKQHYRDCETVTGEAASAEQIRLAVTQAAVTPEKPEPEHIPRPARGEPGTCLEELWIAELFIRTPAHLRQTTADREAVLAECRRQVLEHERPVDRGEVLLADLAELVQTKPEAVARLLNHAQATAGGSNV